MLTFNLQPPGLELKPPEAEPTIQAPETTSIPLTEEDTNANITADRSLTDQRHPQEPDEAPG